ncbi:DUF4149 domain-containing protein [bacterium]|nr:MAG: DUF4149 domain-containing protein [bacterium]
MEKGGTVSTVPPFCLWIFGFLSKTCNLNLPFPMNSNAAPISAPQAKSSIWPQPATIFIRFLVSLALSLWIGGMAFFGIMAAPVLFHPEKSGIPRSADTAIIAPQMVSAMLTRFGTLTGICAIVLLLGWIIDGFLTKSQKKKSWQIQGVLTLICLTLSQYLNGTLLPKTRAEQSVILPIIARADRGEKLSEADQARRAAFDTGHKSYQRLASINLYLLMAVLIILLGRPLAPAQDSSQNGSRSRD